MKKLIMALVVLFYTLPITVTAAEYKNSAVEQRIMEMRRARSMKSQPQQQAEVFQTNQSVEVSKASATEESAITRVAKNAAPSQPPVSTSVGLREVAQQAIDPSAPESKSKWDSFHEVTAYAGAYYSLNAQSKGFWAMAEYTKWFTDRTNPHNYGLGVTAKGDYGWGKDSGVHWGSFSIGPNLDYWTELADNQYLLAKVRPLYRFNEGTKANGFMPGGYLEYSNAFSRKNTFIASLDGQYFKNDSYLGLNLMVEHKLNKDIKIKAGLGLTLQALENETLLGLGPNLSVKFYDRFVLGASVNFIKGGPTFGLYAGYELNTDLILLDAKIREKSVKQKAVGTVKAETPTTDNIQVTKSGENFMTLPGTTDSGIQFSNTTLEEGINK
jgi:hypothetical protein